MKKNKLVVGIDINEVLRAQWLQFDKYYAGEFGEAGIPAEPYVFDFFKEYDWKDTKEVSNILREPGDLPENINPIDYQVDEKGEAPADAFLFIKETNELTAREVYNRFMYEDFVFEIHATAPQMYRGLDLHTQQFSKKYGNTVDFRIVSIENWFSIPSTLSFLSTMLSRFKNISFVDNSMEKWNNVDILITADPEILKNEIPEGKYVIKVSRPFNLTQSGEIEIIQINDLINNKEFQKLIGFEDSPETDVNNIKFSSRFGDNSITE